MKQNMVFFVKKNSKNHNEKNIADYCKVSMAIPLINIVLPELKKGFKGNHNFTFSGFHIIMYTMTSSPNRKNHFKTF